MPVLATTAILPAAATLFFAVFWLGFGFWRRHRWLSYALIAATLAATGVAIHHVRDHVFGSRIELAPWVSVVGWIVTALAWQEELRLVELLDDPAAYERYRQRVPALIPRLRRRR